MVSWSFLTPSKLKFIIWFPIKLYKFPYDVKTLNTNQTQSNLLLKINFFVDFFATTDPLGAIDRRKFVNIKVQVYHLIVFGLKNSNFFTSQKTISIHLNSNVSKRIVKGNNTKER